jgi:hypothetical protein
MLNIQYPKNKQVHQRDNNGIAKVPFQIQADTEVTITIKDLKGNIVKSVKKSPANNLVKGYLLLSSGMYNADIQTQTGSKQTVLFGVGVVLATFGHSFTGAFATSFADDDRIIMPDQLFYPMYDESLYKDTGYISMKDASKETLKNYENNEEVEITINEGIWGRFASKLVKRFDCPVMLLNAGFGGSNLQVAYNVMNGIPFEHPFINYSKGMPVIKLVNFLKFVVPRTGIQACIIIHGDNDKPTPDKNLIAKWYKDILEKFRIIVPNLNFVLCPSVTGWQEDPKFFGIIEGTLQTIAEEKNVIKGADIYQYDDTYRKPDRLHLSARGEERAAEELAEIIGTKAFLEKAPPTLAIEQTSLEAQTTVKELSINTAKSFTLQEGLTLAVLFFLILNFFKRN